MSDGTVDLTYVLESKRNDQMNYQQDTDKQV